MRKLISLSLIASTLLILSNCSPKTSQSTAASKPVASDESKSAPMPSSSIQAQNDPLDKPATTSSSSSLQHPWDGKTADELVEIYRNVNPQRLGNGQSIYESSCKKCHELYSPFSKTASEWVVIMEKMGPNAKLDDGQHMMVSAYLVKNAKN
jgi:hypothetical protein